MPYWYQTLASSGATLQRTLQRLLALRDFSRCLVCFGQGLQCSNRGWVEQTACWNAAVASFGFPLLRHASPSVV